MAGGKNVVQTVYEGILPVAKELGLSIWDVEFLKEGAKRILRVTIDSDEGITIEDCERMHRAIDPVLDEIDPIETAYDLEVSSPGIERELRTDEHIAFCKGERVELRLFAPLEGKKRFEGVLLGLDGEGRVCIDDNGTERAFERGAVAKLQTIFDF